MYQRDYIMRMIEQLGVFLIRILRLKEAKKFDAAVFEIGEAGKTLLGLDFDLIRSLSDEKIIALLKSGDFLNAAKCFIIAELLTEEGDIYEHQGNEVESYRCYLKSFSLYLEIFLNDPQFRREHCEAKINVLFAELSDYQWPDHIGIKLSLYFEKRGEYAKAEDIFFHLIETNQTAVVWKAGFEFYERLLSLSDSQLNNGNLPRREVEEGLHIWREKQPPVNLS